MLAVRRLIAHRHLAALLCAAALALKLLVPAGYMIDGAPGHFAVTICSGVAGQPMTMAMPMPAMHGEMPGHGKSGDHGKPEQPCAFAGLAAASLGSVDPVLLAALVVFLLAFGLAPATAPPVVRRSHLRPPLRGPPLIL